MDSILVVFGAMKSGSTVGRISSS